MKKTLLLLVLVSQSVFASWLSTYQEIVDPIWQSHTWYNEANIEQIPFSRDLKELQANYGNTNMYSVYHEVSDDFIARNNSNINQLLAQALIERRPGPVAGVITRNQARKIFRSLESERVVKRQDKYDPKEVLGLCFGRAIIAHIHALSRGMEAGSVKKIWVLGEMKKWQFHVATILKTTRGWYAIDNYTGFLRVDKWIRFMEKDKKRNARPLIYFVTDAARFGFMSNHIYSTLLLFNYEYEEVENYVEDYRAKRSEDFYRGFFVDFFIDLDRKKEKIRPFF